MTESVTGNNKQAAFVQPDRKVELLAPAGGWEQLEYALHFGANAVYLACDKFGLRSRAANFSLEDLPRAVARVHEMGARVFVTCNIF
ncbi:MAG: U32 family peptidase, partial [Eggerthellaceae bacterium]